MKYYSVENRVNQIDSVTDKPFNESFDALARMMDFDNDSDFDSLKEELNSFLILLNEKGVKLFFEKFKEHLEHIDGPTVAASIALAVLRGRNINKIKEPDWPLLRDYESPFEQIECYETANLDFDFDNLVNRLTRIRFNHFEDVIRLIEDLEQNFKPKLAQKEDEILVLKPALWGMSINLNQLWKKYFKRARIGR